MFTKAGERKPEARGKEVAKQLDDRVIENCP